MEEQQKRKPFGADLLREVPRDLSGGKKTSTRTIRDTYGGGQETDSETDE